MLQAGRSIRFTPAEVEDFRRIGLDFDGTRTRDDLEQVLTQWACTLSDERPELLDKIAAGLAAAKGVALPPRLARER
jgi:hypothetical protein